LADATAWQRLEQRLTWKYPFSFATRQPAKTSVTVLRRQSLANEESHIHSFTEAVASGGGSHRAPASSVPAVDVGSAQHAFLRWVALDQVGSIESLQAEARRLVEIQALTAEAAGLLDFAGLAAFWKSELGSHIRAHPENVQRELVFTARFTLPELAHLTGQQPSVDGQEEFVVVQGVADLVLILADEIWLVDFKTDRAGEQRAAEYELQLKLYARALAQIYRRPVTQSWIYFLTTREAVPISNKG
jgi:ATP-dependent helicase/nuclease subunit A